MTRTQRDPIVYEPDQPARLGAGVWRQMVVELVDSRELIWRLFLRNLSARYKQTALGYLWAVVMPIIPIASFVLLREAGLVNVADTGVPYPVFALVGVTVWQLFSSGVVTACNSLVDAGSMVAKIRFPLEVLVFSSLAQTLFELGVKIVLIALALIAYGYTPSWAGLWLPIALVPMLLMTAGVSLVLALVNGVLRDTAHVVTLLSSFLLFLTPILYPVGSSPPAFVTFNPLTALVNGPRDLVLFGRLSDPTAFALVSGVSLAVFLASWRFFYVAAKKIPERI